MIRKLLIYLFVQCLMFVPVSSHAISQHPSFTVNDNQFVFVSNPEKNRIQVFDSYGVYIKDYSILDKQIRINEIVSCPCGGYLLVSDLTKKEVIVLDDLSGEVLRRIKGIDSIGDMTVSREKERYEAIVNLSTNSIHLYTDKGNLLRIIKGASLFKEASSIHMNFQNQIYVADNISRKLLLIDIRGEVVRTIQEKNVSFGKILDLTTDQSGNLFVLDEIKGLYQFDSQGRKMQNIPYPSSYQPINIGIDDRISKIYLFSEQTLQQMSKDFKVQLKVQKPLQASKKKVIQLKIGSRIMTLVGFDVKIMDAAPFVEPSSNRTFVPLRVISESFKATVSWDPLLNQVTIQHLGTQIKLIIGNRIAKINGISKTLDAPPIIKDNRAFVPLRFIGETFSAEILWYQESRLIRIISPFIE